MRTKKIAVLTSGGDSPGMNAAVRAVTKAGIDAGFEVLGVMEGYKGLIEDNFKKLDKSTVDNVIAHGGTILYSARCLEFATYEGIKAAWKTCVRNNIVGLVAIGGDGTFRGATDLSNFDPKDTKLEGKFYKQTLSDGKYVRLEGEMDNSDLLNDKTYAKKLGFRVKCIGLPGTIDNDISSTDASIGFDTAMNTVIEAVDKLRDTCESHARCDVVEVMGRAAGYVALEAGIAVGATAVLCKEVPYSEDEIVERMKALRALGKRNFLILLAEGVPLDQLKNKTYGEELTKRLEEKTGVESRFARLAHVVRGGAPSLRDRLMASTMGEYAVRLLSEGKTNRVVCQQNDALVDLDINYALMLDKKFKTLLDASYAKAPTEKELARFTPAELAEMDDFCAKKYEAFKDMYRVAEKLGK